jgi:hypothetical protein
MVGAVILTIVCATCGGLLGKAIEGYTVYSTIPTLNNAQYQDLYLPQKYNAFYVNPGVADYDMNRVGVYKIDRGYSYSDDDYGHRTQKKNKDDYYFAVALKPAGNSYTPYNSQSTIWVVNHATQLTRPTNNRMFDGGLFLGSLTTAHEDIDNYIHAVTSIEYSSAPRILYRNKDAKENMIEYRNLLVETIIAAGIFTVIWLLSIATYEKHKNISC